MVKAGAVERIATGHMLPPLPGVAPGDGTIAALQPTPRDALVLLVLPQHVEAWTDYLYALDRTAADIRDWYGHVVVIVTGRDAPALRAARAAAPGLPVLVDAEGTVHQRLGVAAAHAVLLVVDRYGQVYDVVEADAAARLPDPPQLEQWTRFLSTQCPECGVIDEPGGA
jgi:hypothetical protein